MQTRAIASANTDDPKCITPVTTRDISTWTNSKLVASSRKDATLWHPRTGRGGTCPTCGICAPGACLDDHCLHCRPRSETPQAILESVVDITKPSDDPYYMLPVAAEVVDEPQIERACEALMEAEVFKTDPQVAWRRIHAGRCAFCGIQTHTRRGFCAALTIEGRVLHGHCLVCFPIDDNCNTLESQPAEALPSPPADSREGDTLHGSAIGTDYSIDACCLVTPIGKLCTSDHACRLISVEEEDSWISIIRVVQSL
jgi:hypothetical protein